MHTTVEIEDFYPYSYQPCSRYGRGKLPHPLIDAILEKELPRYEALLTNFATFTDEFLSIERDNNAANPNSPYWINGFFPGLDAVVLYGMIATYSPKRYYEIGSGNSTKFAALARNKHSPETEIICIDPAPRAEIKEIARTVLFQPLQDCDLSIFDQLESGDILFFDGSHRVLQNSDVSVFFLDVLPYIKPGVLIQIHDVFWPSDYPDQWAARMYSEQYLLGVLLLNSAETIQVVMPNAYVSSRPNLVALFQQIWDAPDLQGIERHGGSFWFSKK